MVVFPPLFLNLSLYVILDIPEVPAFKKRAQPKEQLKVQYIFEERHRSMKENCLWRSAKKNIKKTNNSAFSATHTYIKLTLVSFFLLFFHAPFPKCIQRDKKIARTST